MRYEHIVMDMSTVALAELDAILEAKKAGSGVWGYSTNAVANSELHNLHNEILARLQRRDVDPHAVQPTHKQQRWTHTGAIIEEDVIVDPPYDGSDLI